MGALKFGIREAGDGEGMAGPDFVKKEITDYVKVTSQTHLLVATLIATVTFTELSQCLVDTKATVWMRAWQY